MSATEPEITSQADAGSPAPRRRRRRLLASRHDGPHAPHIARRTLRLIQTVVPDLRTHLLVWNGDGYVLEGPVLTVAFKDRSLLSHDEQHAQLGPLAAALTAAGVLVQLCRGGDGTFNYTFIEVALDPAFDKRMRRTLAAWYLRDPEGAQALKRNLGML